jgi:hypothetical protein
MEVFCGITCTQTPPLISRGIFCFFFSSRSHIYRLHHRAAGRPFVCQPRSSVSQRDTYRPHSGFTHSHIADPGGTRSRSGFNFSLFHHCINPQYSVVVINSAKKCRTHGIRIRLHSEAFWSMEGFGGTAARRSG